MSISKMFLNDGLMSPSPILLGTTVFLSAILLIRYLIHKSKMSRFPWVGDSKINNLKSVLEEGVAKYPNSPFNVATNPPTLILPQSAISDLKSITAEKGSFWDGVRDIFYSKVSGFGSDEKMLTTVVKHEVNRIVAPSSNTLLEETTISVNRLLGPCENWTSHNAYPFITRIIALVSGRIFVGTSLCRDEDWIDVTVNYTSKLNASRNSSVGWPKWVINLFGPYMKQFKMIEKHRNRAEELVKPLFDAHVAGKVIDEKQSSKQSSEERNAIAWLLDRMNADERKNPRMLVNQLLDMAFAAIHSTSGTLTHALYDLATYREYIPILVDEINTVIAEEGCDLSPDGLLKIGNSTTSKLVKLDSFLKESIRMNPLFLTSLIRKLRTDVKFSDGYTVAKGTIVSVPSWVISTHSSALHSPGLTKPLNEFDGLRFYKLRQLPGNENRHLSVSTSPDSLLFGHGIHACPGRFLACNEMKIILLELLRNWDFRFTNDIKMEGGKIRRPMNNNANGQNLPNHEASLEFRRKRV